MKKSLFLFLTLIVALPSCRLAKDFHNENINEDNSGYVEGEKADDKIIKSISIKTLPKKLEYKLGEELDVEGLEIEGISFDGEVTLIDNSLLKIEGFDSSVVSENQIITVTFEGLSCEFSISIRESNRNHKFKSIMPRLFTEGSPYQVEYFYKDDFFELNHEIRNDKFAQFALGFASNSVTEEETKRMYGTAGFSSGLVNYNLGTSSDDSIGFTIGNKVLDEKAYIIVTIRGHKYDDEWASNFKISSENGKDYSGNHYGFSNSAFIVLDSLKKYIEDNIKEKEIKILFTGFSRGGAVAGMTAANLLDGTFEINGVKKENIYAYTFAAPRGLTIKNVNSNYNAIFNYYNSDDIVGHFIPKNYGFVRPGIDINILEEITNIGEDIPNLLNQFDSRILPIMFNLDLSFKAFDGINTMNDLNNFVIKGLIRKLTEEETQSGLLSYETIDDYNENLKDALIASLKFIYNDRTENYVKEHLILILGNLILNACASEDSFDPNAFYEAMKKDLNNSSINVNDDILKSTCLKITMVVRSLYFYTKKAYPTVITSNRLTNINFYTLMLAYAGVKNYHNWELYFVSLNKLIEK